MNILALYFTFQHEQSGVSTKSIVHDLISDRYRPKFPVFTSHDVDLNGEYASEKRKQRFTYLCLSPSADASPVTSLVGVGTSSSWGSPFAAPIHELTWLVSPENIFTGTIYYYTGHEHSIYAATVSHMTHAPTAKRPQKA